MKDEEIIKVLDKGFVRLIDTMGNDDAIVQAARVSYGNGTKKVSEDKALIRYLMRNKHTSPFEMCEIKLHIKAPIFIARQWLRHRTANVNEISARYSIIKDEFYEPEDGVYRLQSNDNKQGSYGSLDDEELDIVNSNVHSLYEQIYSKYEDMLAMGICREQARAILPVSIYTEFYWKIDLHNLFHFLKLRLDSHAQHEIRVYAQAIAQIIKKWCPVAYDAFEDYVLNRYELSLRQIAYLINKDSVSLSSSEEKKMNEISKCLSTIL